MMLHMQGLGIEGINNKTGIFFLCVYGPIHLPFVLARLHAYVVYVRPPDLNFLYNVIENWFTEKEKG